MIRKQNFDNDLKKPYVRADFEIISMSRTNIICSSPFISDTEDLIPDDEDDDLFDEDLWDD